jgi:hypothetical protein
MPTRRRRYPGTTQCGPRNAAAQPVTAGHAGRRGELAAAVGEDGQHLGHHPLAGVSSGAVVVLVVAGWVNTARATSLSIGDGRRKLP